MNQLSISEIRHLLKRTEFAVRDWYRRCSTREKGAVIAILIFMVVIISYQIYLPIADAFEAQASRMEAVEKHVKSVSFVVDRYSKLKLRREQIEDAYKEIEIVDGERSLLERLIQEKIGLEQGAFTISARAMVEFGGSYEQAPFNVKFSATSLERVVDFLSEVVHGKTPLLLTRLDIAKSRSGDRIDVEIDVSSIRKKAGD